MGVLDGFKDQVMKEVESKVGPVIEQMKAMNDMLGTFGRDVAAFSTVAKEMDQHLKVIEHETVQIRKLLEGKHG
ncbi:MAG: hypothetical protein PHI12_08130 [Dehalococcoidales bacterium]|jgi:hypothetical protein|nr:hypothetical protein [Dehalococcoidales bacterium]